MLLPLPLLPLLLLLSQLQQLRWPHVPWFWVCRWRRGQICRRREPELLLPLLLLLLGLLLLLLGLLLLPTLLRSSGLLLRRLLQPRPAGGARLWLWGG